MNIKIGNRLFAFGLVVSLAVYSVAGQAQAQFSKLVTFGDSLSDTGNLSSVTFDFPFPFYQNRISDGPLLVDYIASHVGSTALASRHLDNNLAGFNYAIAGGNVLGNDREDLNAQVSAHLLRVGGQVDSQALVLVLMGGNDLRDVRSVGSMFIAETMLDSIIQTLKFELSRLIAAGAKTLVVPNAANIGRLPETIAREASDPGISARATRYTQLFNQKLAVALAQLQANSNAKLISLNLYDAFEGLIANASQLGFTQTQVGCFQLSGFNFHPDCRLGTRFDRFVFFDNLHPSSNTNLSVSRVLLRELDAALVVPKAPSVAPAIYLLLSD